MSKESKRLLMAFEQEVKTINRQIINPSIEELEINNLRPVFELVANARGQYLKAFFAAGAESDSESHAEFSIEKFDDLKRKREVFEELLHASHELQIAIEKEYLDVSPSPEGHPSTQSSNDAK